MSELKKFIKMDSNGDNILQPRFVAKEHVVFQKNHSDPILMTDQLQANQTNNQNNFKTFKTINDTSNVTSFVKNNDPLVGYQLVKNPYVQEKIFIHPLHPQSSVTLSPKEPLSRDIPIINSNNFHTKMGDFRHQEELKNVGKEISTPHFESPHYNILKPTTGIPRITPLKTEINEKQPVNSKTPQVAKPDSFLWRNMNEYAPDQSMFQYLPNITDTRLEERKRE